MNKKIESEKSIIVAFRVSPGLWEKIKKDAGEDKLVSEVVRDIVRKHYGTEKTGKTEKVRYAKAIPVQ